MVIEYGQYSDIGGLLICQLMANLVWLHREKYVICIKCGWILSWSEKHCNVITRQKHLQSRSDNIYNVKDETGIIWCLEILNHLTILEQLSILTACQDEIAFVIIQRVEAKLHCFANHGDVAPKRCFCKLTLMVYIPGLKEIIGHDLTL